MNWTKEENESAKKVENTRYCDECGDGPHVVTRFRSMRCWTCGKSYKPKKGERK